MIGPTMSDHRTTYAFAVRESAPSQRRLAQERTRRIQNAGKVASPSRLKARKPTPKLTTMQKRIRSAKPFYFAR